MKERVNRKKLGRSEVHRNIYHKKGSPFFSFCFRAPFDVSLTVLMVMCVIVAVTWSENYGNKSHSLKQSMTKAATSIRDGMCYHAIRILKKEMVIFLLSLHENSFVVQ